MPEILIREMQPADISEIMEIERKSFSTPWSELSFLNEMYDLHSISKVALLNNNITGYICVKQKSDEGHILNLAVHPDFRRHGYATTLVGKVLDELRKRGCKYLYLEVRVSNLGARKFYERIGFKVVGVRRKYYTSPDEDAVVMMLVL
ncbi:MAG: ribosomal protein S18-alanine N-acetyltransferase [Nitrospirota bacterium]